VVSDHDITDLAFPGYKYAYLPVDLPGELGKVSGKLVGDDLIGGYFSSVELEYFL